MFCSSGATAGGFTRRSGGGARSYATCVSDFSRFLNVAVTGSASQTCFRELVRTRRIELLSPEWRAGIGPINYIRMVRPRGFEPLVGRPACFIDAGFTDRWQEKDAKTGGRRRSRTFDREVGPAFETGCVPPRATFRTGCPGATRTRVPRFRKAVLSSTELRDRKWSG